MKKLTFGVYLYLGHDFLRPYKERVLSFYWYQLFAVSF